ncbi:MAG TPA: type II toxin-antitoxin system VapB family antitoxin [Thermoanaerobaculia bacterium]|jgi:Arc/MetJ family transcription regulator|nr:type II toxin-antitoxin system VapB family antitoxin [Thermoanaerobaculia bacterium]
MRTNVDLNDQLIEEAFALTGARTKRELLHLALQELVRVRRKRDLTDLAGRIRLHDDFDHKAMRDLNRDPG